ncbi:hypothetical protein F7725_018060 [Dissostichus mawsoni]|uniref:E3 ubiquitin-protein ligase CBL n=1 Tax=Dissostichus mawsoni TaxID=36200 RepID=A0A7J5XRA7_DISMA|nr:hypothetical protein F7725_018060 [Dissostichus mawsoni]
MAATGSGASLSPKSSSQTPTSGDRRLLDKTLKRLHKLGELCTNPRLGLRNSPPYLPELVSETTTLLTQVWEPYRGPRGPGGQAPRGDEAKYLRVHIRNLMDKTDRALLLFKEGRDKMFEDTSSCRRNLTKLSLLFSHMLWELRAMFPGGSYQGDTYRVTKPEAKEFWMRSFGNKCFVQWNNFKEQLQSVHAFEEGMESMALKSTIDLTCNDYISLAVTHPGYMAFLTYDQVIARLEHYLHRPGSYIFRLSCTRMGQWAIGHVTSEGGIVQTIPQNTPLYQALIQGFKEGCYLYPDGRDVNPDLTSLCEPAHRGKVRVSEEQYEIYCDISSTFQLCKICTERDKDTRIQPCGHLLCQPCLTGWQKSAGQTCPYCRCDIRGTESILVEPFLPGSGQWGEEVWITKFPGPTSAFHLCPLKTSPPHTLHFPPADRGPQKPRPRKNTPTQVHRLKVAMEHVEDTNKRKRRTGAAAWLGPSSPVKQRQRHKEREERRAGLREDKCDLEEMTRRIPYSLIAILGDNHIWMNEGTEQFMSVDAIYWHQSYDYQTLDYDIMLMKLAHPVTVNQYVKPIALPKACPAAGDMCMVSGWGNIYTDQVFNPFYLQCVEVPILSHKDCDGSYPGLITDRMVCAGYLEEGKDACQVQQRGSDPPAQSNRGKDAKRGRNGERGSEKTNVTWRR